MWSLEGTNILEEEGQVVAGNVKKVRIGIVLVMFEKHTWYTCI